MWFLLFVLTLLLKIMVVAVLAIMWCQLAEVTRRGRDAAVLKREAEAVSLHRESANTLVWAIAAEVVLVFMLEILVRSSRHYLALPTAVFWIHLLSATVFVATVLGMRFLMPGTTHGPVHVFLGRYAVWTPFWVMAGTGVVLVAGL